MKATELHLKHLENEIPRLLNGNFRVGDKNVIFRSDSKGRSFLPYFTNKRINLVYRSGENINANFMQGYTLNRIRHTNKPIVVLFFGTCEITDKRGRFIYIPQDIEQRVNDIIESYIKYKIKILQYNPDATVIFLDCPYFSLTICNFLRKHPTPGIFDQDQKKLEAAILLLNRKLKDINGDRVVPRLSKDFMFSTKKKNKNIIKLRNYNLLRDGVHPGQFLTKLWALRITRMIALN